MQRFTSTEALPQHGVTSANVTQPEDNETLKKPSAPMEAVYVRVNLVCFFLDPYEKM